MSDEDVKQAYWRRRARATFAVVLLIVGLAVFLPLFAPAFNGHRFLRFPLGYFLVAHAGVIAIAAVVYVFFNGQERTDRQHNMTIQF